MKVTYQTAFILISFFILLPIFGCQPGFKRVNGKIPDDKSEECIPTLNEVKKKWKKSTSNDYFIDYYQFDDDLYNNLMTNNSCFVDLKIDSVKQLFGNPTRLKKNSFHYLLYRKQKGKILHLSLDFHFDEQTSRVTMFRSGEIMLEFD